LFYKTAREQPADTSLQRRIKRWEDGSRRKETELDSGHHPWLVLDLDVGYG